MSPSCAGKRPSLPLAQGGFSLVELMVAGVLGLFLIGGALAIHVHGHASYRINESLARLQENARVALDLIVPELRLAGYWAQTDTSSGISGRLADTNPLDPGFAPPNDCYNGHFINLDQWIEAANDDQLGGANPFAACVPDSVREPGTDIVVIRRAASAPTPPGALSNGRLYLISNRIGGALFIAGQPLPGGFAAGDPIHEILVHAFYVNATSSLGDDVPSLHRIRLADGPVLVDEELVPGIEDLQFQIGIDADDDGSVESYFNPGNAALAGAPMGAARLWVRARSDRAELGFTDDASYVYANVSIEPGDAFRRTLMSSTIQLRNVRRAL